MTPRERSLRAIRRSLPAAAQTHIQDFLEGLTQAIELEVKEATQESNERADEAMQKAADLLLANCALADELAVRDEADSIEQHGRDGQ